MMNYSRKTGQGIKVDFGLPLALKEVWYNGRQYEKKL